MLSPQPEPTPSGSARTALPALTTPVANDFLFRAMDAFLRHIWLFFLCFAVVTGIVCAALLLRERTYTAEVSTQVVSENIARSLSAPTGWDETEHAGYHVSRFNDLASDNREAGFMATALASAALKTPINLDPRTGDVERYKKLLKNLIVNAESDKVFTIGLVWDDPEECGRIVAALQQQYVEAVGAGQQARSLATVEFLNGQILRYEELLKKAEAAVIAYKSENYGQLPAAQDADIKQFAELRSQLAENLNLVQGSRAREKALSERLAKVNPTIVQEQTFGTSPTSARLQTLENQRSVLRAQGRQDTGGQLLDINDEIARLTAQRDREHAEAEAEAPEIAGSMGSNSAVLSGKFRPNPEYASVSQALSDAQIARQTQERQIELLKGQVGQFGKRVQKIPAEQKKLNDRLRDSTVVKKRYDALVEQREDARFKANLDKATAKSGLRQLGAIRPETTINKKKTIALLAASVFLGLLVGACMIVFSEWADTSVRYASDAPRFFDVPLLSSVPRQKEWIKDNVKDKKR